jgi:hypothetical protein
LKKHFTDRHVPLLGHIIVIPSQPVFTATCLGEKQQFDSL